MSQCSHIDNIFQELPEARVFNLTVAEFGQGNINDGNIGAGEIVLQGSGGVKQKIAAGQDFVIVLTQGLAVDGHDQIGPASPSQIPVFIDTNLIPCR